MKTFTIYNLEMDDLEDILLFTLRECKTFRNSYTVPSTGRMMEEDRDITDEIVKREKAARRMLANLRKAKKKVDKKPVKMKRVQYVKGEGTFGFTILEMKFSKDGNLNILVDKWTETELRGEDGAFFRSLLLDSVKSTIDQICVH
jgi:hypothetical protein